MNTQTQNTTQYKNSALGLIPEDWDIRTLGEVTDYIKGFAFSSNDYTTEGIRIIRISDTTSTSIKEEGAIYMNIDDAPKYKKWELQLNDLVFTTVGSRPPMYDSMVGKVIKIEDKYKGSFLNQNAVIIRAKEGTNQEFIYGQFKVKRYLDFIETIVRGNANQVSITLDNLFKYQLLFPSTEEQKAIASCLSTWDIVIEKQNALIAQKELSKKALMQQLLSGKKRLKGFSGEWGKLKLGIDCELITKGTTPTSLGREFKDKGVNFIKIESLEENGTIIPNKVAFIDEQTHEMLKRSQLKENDILISIAGALGRVALVNKEILPANTNQALAIIRLKKVSKLKLKYLYYFLNSPKVKKEIDAINVQAAQANLSLSNINDLTVLYPSIEEQTAIANVLECADTEIQLLKNKLTQLKEQKKGLMQVLLTGKKRLRI